jgi:hypothetical protein
MKATKFFFTCSTIILALLYTNNTFGQAVFTKEPANAVFIKTDINNFWKAFDKIESEKNPFVDYLEEGTIGLKDFIPYRIESASNLLKIVKSRKEDYLDLRNKLDSLDKTDSIITPHYKTFKSIYPEAIFPPVYYVIGAFNTGGGATQNGIIIGTEVTKNEFENIAYFVIHELIHFNQKYDKKPIGKSTLLEQSIAEGSADFLASLIMKKAYKVEYAESHLDELCNEFVGIMNGKKYHGWLYGSKGKKEGRPNDLGYWMGYKITEAYYQASNNKNQAVAEILNIKDFKDFMQKSGYLNKWIN